MLEIRLSNSWRLEVALIKYCVLSLWNTSARISLASRVKRNAQADYGTEAIGTKEGGVPGNRGAPIMAGYHRCFLVDGIK
jgi:hypothetical protein